MLGSDEFSALAHAVGSGIGRSFQRPASPLIRAAAVRAVLDGNSYYAALRNSPLADAAIISVSRK